MAYLRRLAFFNETNLTESGTNSSLSSLSDVNPTCTTSGRDFLWLGTQSGEVYLVDRTRQVISFKAYQCSVRHVYQLRQHDLLISIGTNGEELDSEEQIKVWNLSKWMNKSGPPFCCRTSATTASGQTSSPVTCIAVDESLQFIVLGHQNGVLQLLKGELTRNKQYKRTVLHTFASPVHGVGLYTPPDVGGLAPQTEVGGITQVTAVDARNVSTPKFGALTRDKAATASPLGPVIFAACSYTIMCFLMQPRRPDELLNKTVLDSFTIPLTCTCMFHDSSGAPQFAVAYKDAIYFYNLDGRGPCLASEGDKLAIGMFKHYLVTVKGSSAFFISDNRSHNAKDVAKRDTTATSSIIIHDIRNKFIAGEFSMPRLLAVFLDANAIYALTSAITEDGCGAETRKMLICLSEKNIQDQLEMLYSKKNFQMAIEIVKSQSNSAVQLGTIYTHYADHLYKNKEYDAAVIEYIKTIGTLEPSFVIQRFLEGGHISQLAQYLEALTKLPDLCTKDYWTLLLTCYSRLQDKLKIDKLVMHQSLPENLDVEAAIHVLRQSDFFDTALELAKTTKRFSDCIDILLEDLNDPHTALQFIQKYPFDEALKAVCNYGHVLMEKLPTETLQLLERLCNDKDASRINVRHLLKVFINNREGLMHFLDRFLKNNAISVEVNGVVDTLLELTVNLATSPGDAAAGDKSRIRLREATLHLLKDDRLPYDSMKALLLCHHRHFMEGCIFLWEKLGMYDQLLKYYVGTDSVDEILETCHKYDDKMPQLWLQALSYFSRRPDCPAQLQLAISAVDKHSLASPLSVLQTLSNTDEQHSCTVGTVRDYFLKHLAADSARIESMRSELQQLREETMRNREVVRNLNTQIKVFQQLNCLMCHQSLEPPSVHFLCDHSYHKLCFDNYSTGESQCPECAHKNSKLLAGVAAPKKTGSTAILTDTSTDAFILDLQRALEGVHNVEQPSGTGTGTNTPQLSHVLGTLVASQAFDPAVIQRVQPVVTSAPTSANLPSMVQKAGLVHQAYPNGSSPPVIGDMVASATGASKQSQSSGYFSSSSRPADGSSHHETAPSVTPFSSVSTPFDDLCESGPSSGCRGAHTGIEKNPFD